jgi:hypothetical protein
MVFPNALLLFVPLAALIIYTLRSTGFGRLLYAVGDNERAARIAGVLYWQVILALYVVSGLLAGVAGLLYVGLIKAPSLSLAEPLLLPSVAAAVIGGTSMFGGRGGYGGTIVGGADPDRADHPAHGLADARRVPPGAFRTDHPGRHGRLYPHHRRLLINEAGCQTSCAGRARRSGRRALCVLEQADCPNSRPMRHRRPAAPNRGPVHAG